VTAPELPTEEAVDVLDRPEAGGMAIRGTMLRAGGYGVITLLGLISAPIITRHLGVIDFGRYTAVMSLVTLLALVTEGGISAYGMRELAVLDRAGQKTLMRHLVGIRVALTLAGALLAVAFAAAAGYGAALVLGTALAGAGVLTYAAQGTVALPLAAELRLGWITAADVLRQIVFVLAVVALVLAGAGVTPLLGAAIPAGLAGTLLLVHRLRGRIVWRPAYDRATWTAILRQALPIAAAGAINSAYFRAVILLMSIIAAEVQLGYFALSFRVVEILVAVPALVVGSLMPIFSRAARDDQERLGYAFRRTYDIAVVAGTLLTLLTFTGAPLAISVLTEGGAGPAVDVLRVQSLTLVAVFVNVAYASVLIALRRHRELILVNAFTLLLTLVAALVLVPLEGALGGAIAAALGEWALLAAYVVALRRARPDLHPSHAFVLRAAVAAAVAVAAATLIDVPWIPNLAGVAVAGVAYLLALAAVGGVPPEVWQALLRRRGPGP
jgi:O-antigen/teichoic acid export membrane protein